MCRGLQVCATALTVMRVRRAWSGYHGIIDHKLISSIVYNITASGMIFGLYPRFEECSPDSLLFNQESSTIVGLPKIFQVVLGTDGVD
jgi:hypothetical protein